MKRGNRGKSAINLSEELGKAITLHQNGQFQQAKVIYKKIIRHSPMHPEALHMLGILYTQTGKLETAIDLMCKSIKHAPGRPDYLFNLARAYHDLGNLDDAIATYQEYLRFVPDDSEALHMLGRAMHDKRAFEQAIICFQRALEKSPERVDYLNSLGLTYHAHGDWEQAIICYELALKHQPNDFIVLNNLGETFRKLKKYANATACFRQALYVKPDSARVLNNLGIVLREEGKLEDAAGNFQKAVADKPDYAEAHYNLGLVLSENGRGGEAITCFEKALSIKPEYAEAHHNFGVILKAQGRIEESIIRFKKALAFKPDYLRAQTYLAIISWTNGDWVTCEKYLDSISNTKRILSDKESKFVVPYHIFLVKLLKYRALNANRYLKDKCLPIIYVVGDSHCLSTAHTIMNYKNVDYSAEAKIVIGCKAWHLGNKVNNRFKYEFEKKIDSIPYGSVAILMFGEIDCRLEEGIIKNYKKNNVNLTESITHLVDDYLSYIIKKLYSREIISIICNVPVQLIKQYTVSDADKKLQEKVLAIFNQALKNNLSKKQIPLLDVYTFSKKQDNVSDNECHIDRYHLRPSVFTHLIKEL
ncbi:MAG: tetratricopeptide repeat protein [Thermodesulfobacteriota bacterium]